MKLNGKEKKHPSTKTPSEMVLKRIVKSFFSQNIESAVGGKSRLQTIIPQSAMYFKENSDRIEREKYLIDLLIDLFSSSVVCIWLSFD